MTQRARSFSSPAAIQRWGSVESRYTESPVDSSRHSSFGRAVLHYPRWARVDFASAQVLAAYGREQLTPDWPDELAAELATVNDDLTWAVAAFTRRWYGSMVQTVHRRAMTFALLDLPSSAIRRYLVAGKPPSESLDPSIRAAARRPQ